VRQLPAIVYAYDPLSVSAISVLMQMSIEHTVAALSSLHSLLFIPSQDPDIPIAIFHTSFYDFITSPIHGESFLITHENAGSRVGAIAGKHRLWCPGSCPSLLPFATSLQAQRYVFVCEWLVPGIKIGGLYMPHFAVALSSRSVIKFFPQSTTLTLVFHTSIWHFTVCS